MPRKRPINAWSKYGLILLAAGMLALFAGTFCPAVNKACWLGSATLLNAASFVALFIGGRRAKRPKTRRTSK